MRIVLLGLLYLYSGWAATLTDKDFGTLRSLLERQCEAAPYRSVFQAVSKGFDHAITCFIKADNCEKLLSPTWTTFQRELSIGESRLLRSRGIDDYRDNVCFFEMKIQTAIPVCKYGWTVSQRNNGPWQCYKTELTMPKTYEEATEICAKQGAKLPQITTETDFDALIESWVSKSLGRNITDRTIFIGLAERSLPDNGDFVWDFDGTSVGSRSNQFPQFASAANSSMIKRCAVLRGNYDNNRIQQWFCDCVNQDCKDVLFKIRAVACQMAAQLEPQLFCGKGYTITRIGGKVVCTQGRQTVNATTTPQYFCEDSWYISNRPSGPPVCMKTQFSNTTAKAITYDEGKSFCEAQGGGLPQILTQQDYDVLMKSWKAAIASPDWTSVYLGIKNYAPDKEVYAGSPKEDLSGIRARLADFVWDFDGTALYERPNGIKMYLNYVWDYWMPTYQRCVSIQYGYEGSTPGDFDCDVINYTLDHDNFNVRHITCMKVASTLST